MKTPPQNEARTAGAAISRQPLALRDAVSRALVDGADWRKISRLCAEHGLAGVNAQNVTNYRQGAHQEWLRREERLDSLRRDSESTAAVVKHYIDAGGSPAEAGLMAAAEIMAGSLSGMGPEMFKELLADDPKALFGMVRELSRVAELLERRRPKPQDSAAAEAAAVKTTPEERTRMLKEIFGLP